MLIRRRHLEIGKDHKDDKDVVNTQRLFNDVAGEEFYGLLFAKITVNKKIEAHGQRDPYTGPYQGIFDGNLFGFFVKYT